MYVILAEHVVILRDFTEYILSYREYGTQKSKVGLYGLVGDKEMKSALMFVETEKADIKNAKKELKKGEEVRYFEGRSIFIGKF